jgi:hypothetical protein
MMLTFSRFVRLIFFCLVLLGMGQAQSLIRQFGSSQTDLANDIAIDSEGNLVIVGFSQSALPRNEHQGGSDAFVTKMTPQGDTLFTVQVGTPSGDVASAVALDSADNSYVVGGTEGNLADDNLGINDAFLLSFDSQGNERFRRQFGSNLDDGAVAVTVDAADNVYVAGFTRLALAGQESAGGSDVYVKSFDSQGNERWTVQFGSSRDDIASALTVLADGSLFVGGSAEGAMPSNQHSGNRDGFVAKITPAGGVDFIFQFGTQRNDALTRLESDGLDNIYGVGVTQGLFGMNNAGSDDVFVIHFNANGITQTLEQLGTDRFDAAEGFALGSDGQLYLTGFTQGSFTTSGNAGGNDVFLLVLNSNLQQVRVEQFGTLENESARAVAVDANGTVYVVGGTEGVLADNVGVGNRDAFLAVY